MKYAGIGARKTPQPVLDMMTMIGTILAQKGLILRSGCAAGADTAFETGARAAGATAHAGGLMVLRVATLQPRWLEHAAKFHPNWSACNDDARALHARNSGVMLGDMLDDPVAFVICWTPGGAIVGGTGQALRIAAAPEYNIPLFNLFWPEHGAALWEWIGKLQ